MSRTNVASGGEVRVMAERCSTCIFKPGNLMHLQPGRVRDMIDHCKRVEGVIPCHKTLELEQQAICRGMIDAYMPPALQIAERLGLTRDVTL